MIESILLWHKRARPEPDHEQFNVQLGCHIEEMAELLQEISCSTVQGSLDAAVDYLIIVANALKCGASSANVVDRHNFLKELCDGVVTAAGVAHTGGYALESAMQEVNRSNWSKFDENGLPVFNKHGKITKGSRYSAADLNGMF
jgi:hypothetical protein